MVIKNYDKLAKTALRRDALTIVEAGYESIDIEKLFTSKLHMEGDKLILGANTYDLTKFKHIYVVGVGKGSGLAAKAIEKLLTPERITAGAIIDITTRRLKKIKSCKGTHPLPSEQNIAFTEEIIRIMELADKDDLVISIICGGGSALFCKPGGLTCLELQFISSVLLRAGASIQEINTVRKHVSLIHGGYMAKYAYPATVLSLIISDVPGDQLEMVSSGPTVMDTTTKADAERVAKQYGLPSIGMIETPKDAKYFKKVTNVLIASGSQTVEAMAIKARALGYQPVVYSKRLSGLAKEVGPAMAARVKPGEALLACGETEVIVTHPGMGGRNQDVVLSALTKLPDDAVIISAASDGKDNVPVAGGIADGDWSRKQCAKLGIDPMAAVEENRGYKALHKLGDHLLINHITANISDFILVLRGKE
jgi:glycerate-2-kinase